MSTEFKMPSDEEMPAALAELMLWKRYKDLCDLHVDPTGKLWSTGLTCYASPLFQPLKDRNHSRRAVEDCERLALQYEYIEELVKEVMPNRVSGGGMTGGPYVTLETFTLALATPAQESRAAYRTLWNHHNKETK